MQMSRRFLFRFSSKSDGRRQGGPLDSRDLILERPVLFVCRRACEAMASIVKCTCANRYELRRRAGADGST